MGLTIGISGSLLCDKGGQMTVSRVRQQYPTLSKTPPTTSKCPLKQTVFRFICPSHLLNFQ